MSGSGSRSRVYLCGITPKSGSIIRESVPGGNRRENTRADTLEAQALALYGTPSRFFEAAPEGGFRAAVR